MIYERITYREMRSYMYMKDISDHRSRTMISYLIPALDDVFMERHYEEVEKRIKEREKALKRKK